MRELKRLAALRRRRQIVIYSLVATVAGVTCVLIAIVIAVAR